MNAEAHAHSTHAPAAKRSLFAVLPDALGLATFVILIATLLVSAPSPAPLAPTTAAEKIEWIREANTLSLFGIVLAFLAYVAIAEEKILERWRDHTLRHGPTDRAKYLSSYILMVVGDIGLIALSLLLLNMILPRGRLSVLHGSPWWITMITWVLALGFASQHVRSWVRGCSRFRAGVGRDSSIQGLCCGTFLLFSDEDKTYLAARGRHDADLFDVRLEAGAADSFYLIYRVRDRLTGDGSFCRLHQVSPTVQSVCVVHMAGQSQVDHAAALERISEPWNSTIRRALENQQIDG